MRKMTSSMATFLVALILGVSGMGLAGCEQDTGDKMEDAVDDMGDSMEEGVEDMGDAADDVGDEMEDSMN